MVLKISLTMYITGKKCYFSPVFWPIIKAKYSNKNKMPVLLIYALTRKVF